MEKITAIILAAGKGTRMKSKERNKVTLEVAGKPMLVRTIDNLKMAGINKFVVVVGYAKDSVEKLLDDDVVIAEQKKRLGTGHAVEVALKKIPNETKNVLIIYGDDAFMHRPDTFKKLVDLHNESGAMITFITMISDSPTGFGRILRENGEIVGIVEEKNATDEEKKIKEINLGCYVIDLEYLKKNIKAIKRNEVTGEYYITDIIDIISTHKGKISGYRLLDEKWRGVNTREDLQLAQSLISE